MPRAMQESIAAHLELAWARIPAHGSDFDLPDIMRVADIAADWPNYKSALVNSIANGTYHPEHVDIVDLPKDRLTVRPLARMNVRDRLVYEACVFAMAPEIDRPIPRHIVYSYRWWRAKGDLVPGVSQWLKMMRRGKYLHKSTRHFLLPRQT